MADFSDEIFEDAVRELRRDAFREERELQCAATLRAFARARAESAAWSRVYEQVRETAVADLRAAGMSYSQIAKALDLTKARVTRLLAASVVGSRARMQPDWGDAEQHRFDDMWIDAGDPAVASPAGQYRRGKITAVERDRLDAEYALARQSIPEQLRQAVEAHPGRTAPELLFHMRVAVADAATVSFTHHAAAAHVVVDASGRYWPTVAVDDLVPGDRVPREKPPMPPAEWVTVSNIHRADNGAATRIDITLDDGLTSQWNTLTDRYPVDRTH